VRVVNVDKILVGKDDFHPAECIVWAGILAQDIGEIAGIVS